MAKGIYTNAELVDTIILDLNSLPKNLFDGQYILFCNTLAQMGQKLVNLREGIKADIASKDKTIEQLKEMLRNNGQEFETFTPEEFVEKLKKDGADNATT